MARQPRKSKPDRINLDAVRYGSIHQIGGMTTATLDFPGVGGVTQGTRVALVNTGSGLRFTVNLDRGGDIIDASFNSHGLAYLTPNGFTPGGFAYTKKHDWLQSWQGGLVTTCGPRFTGHQREEDGETVGLHGFHHNLPAAVEMVLNPDPPRGRQEMLLSMVIRESRMFGPVIETRRQIQCVLGEPLIIIHDQVTNRGNQPSVHSWLYHCNFGFPLLDQGARMIYRGVKDTTWNIDPVAGKKMQDIYDNVKNILPPQRSHSGEGGRLIIVEPVAARDGLCHVGIVNRRLGGEGLAVELIYDPSQLPRLANWQHLAPAGSYVTGLEPFAGTLMGKANDKHPAAAIFLEPGETRRYQLTLKVHSTAKAIDAFVKHDGVVTD